MRLAGVENVSPQDVADKVSAAARAQVPEAVQREMLGEIRRFLDATLKF